MHAWALAENLGIPHIIVPYTPGLHSALGLLATNLRVDQSQTVLESTITPNILRLLKIYRELDTQLLETMEQQGVAKAEVQLTHSADLRYQGQAYEISLPVPNTSQSKTWIQDLERRFHSRHEQMYGYAANSSPVTIVNLRVEANHRMPALSPIRIDQQQDQPVDPKQIRPVYFEETKGFVETPIYDRTSLGLGARIVGPAIIEQVDATTVVHPKTQAIVQTGANMVLEVTP
jgi:N-methylhydantoinase A